MKPKNLINFNTALTKLRYSLLFMTANKINTALITLKLYRALLT